MNLLNFGDIISLTKQRCNLSDTTDYDDLIKTAINTAYTIEIPKAEKLIVKTMAPIINGVAALPDDTLTIEKITPGLTADDEIKGYYLFTDRTDITSYEMWYSPVIDNLIDDTDIPEVNKKWYYSMSTYGCYVFYLTKKKLDIASAYLSEFNNVLNNLRVKNNIPQYIENVYADNMGAW